MFRALRSTHLIVILAFLPGSIAVASDSLTVCFRFTDTTATAVRAFTPGEFNDWGPSE